MIPSAAVDAYLARSLDTHLWAKALEPGEVDRAIAALRPRPRLYPRLRHHQKVCFLLGVAYPGFGFFLDMGTGKTLLSLELLRYWWDVGRLRRALVFVTSDKAFPTWEDQIEEYEIGLPYRALEGSSEDKWAQLDDLGEGIGIVTYPGATAMASTLQKIKNKRKRKRVLDDARVRALSEWAGALVFDESTKCGNHGSLTFQLANRLRKHTDIRYLLAGRPFGRDPTMLWPQYQLIDGGEALGQTLGLFRAAFFREQKVYWDKSGRARDYTFKNNLRPVLSRMIQHRAMTYGADECIDMPEIVRIEEKLSFPDEAETYYRRVVDNVIAAKGNLREMKNAFTRMRQVSSGFVGVMDDETGERAEIEFAQNPKLERTLELMDELPEGRKMVVFVEFTWSGRRLTEALVKAGFDPIWLWSGTVDSRRELARFQKDPKCEVAVINHKVGAYSLDGLQRVSNYCVFYESPVGVIDREQAERRLCRDGQVYNVFQHDLLVRGSVDRRILEFHAEGEDLMKALVRDPSRVVG